MNTNDNKKREELYHKVLIAINQMRSITHQNTLAEIPTGVPRSLDSGAPLVKALGRFIEPFSARSETYYVTFQRDEYDRAYALCKAWDTYVGETERGWVVMCPDSITTFHREYLSGKHRRFWSR